MCTPATASGRRLGERKASKEDAETLAHKPIFLREEDLMEHEEEEEDELLLYTRDRDKCT